MKTWRHLLCLLLFLGCAGFSSAGIEAPDGSVCFSNCNGHGNCIDYSCHCFQGYHGDDCGTTFFKEGQEVVHILTAGHFNVTRKNFTKAVTKNKNILVGFSSYQCHKCITAENAYANVSKELLELGVPFARADIDSMRSIAMEHYASEPPSLVFFKKQRPLPYRGIHAAEPIVAYVKKLIGKPTRSLATVDDVKEFMASRQQKYSLSNVHVVAFFADHEGIEEDEYDDWIAAAEELQDKEDIYFATVTDPKTSEWFKKNKTIDRTPALWLVGEANVQKTINLDELFGKGDGIKEWIANNAIPLVGRLTPLNFRIYEKLMKPMLMLFLDLSKEEDTEDIHSVVGGRSGGILNEVLLDEFREVAKEHSDSIIFAYVDGTKFVDQMRSLGLYGGAERLPSLAFNTRDKIKAPFPEELAVNRDTMMQFVADFLSGKLKTVDDSKEMAKRALQRSVPLSQKNQAVRKEKKKPPEQVRGVSEQFGDGTAGDLSVTKVTLANFDSIVMQEDKDVVLLLYAQSCESCANFAVYFKKMAERFRDLDISTLVISRMDVTSETPPAQLQLMESPLPILVMIPAYEKHPPWNFYSGLGKVQPMMKWVHAQAAIPFDMPMMPHLSPKEREMYKVQVREREEHLEQKRREEARAMAAEERAQKEIARQKRKAAKEEENAPVEETSTKDSEVDTKLDAAEAVVDRSSSALSEEPTSSTAEETTIESTSESISSRPTTEKKKKNKKKQSKEKQNAASSASQEVPPTTNAAEEKKEKKEKKKSASSDDVKFSPRTGRRRNAKKSEPEPEDNDEF